MEKSQIDPVEETIHLLHEIKRDKNPIYPYYIIADTYSKPNIDFLILVEIVREKPVMTFYPFIRKQGPNKQNKYVKLNPTNLILQGLPQRSASVLKIQKLQIKQMDNSVRIQSLKFVIGYRLGYLLVVQLDCKKNHSLKVQEKLNKLKSKQSIWAKTANLFYSGQQYYKLWIKHPVRKLCKHTHSPYKYSYQIGNSIILLRQLKQQHESILQNQYQQTNWADPNLFLKSNNQLIHTSKNQYFGIRLKEAIRITWKNSLSSYEYTHSQDNPDRLFIANESSIILMDLTTFIIIHEVCFDYGIRNISLYKEILLIMPYDDCLFILEYQKGLLIRYCKLTGHRAYIMQTILADNGNIVSAGADHRICITPYQQILKWQYPLNKPIKKQMKSNELIKKQQQQKTKQQLLNQSNIKKIQTIRISRSQQQKQKQKVDHQLIEIDDKLCINKFKDIYSLKQSNNSRSNIYDHGFGNLIKLGYMYCFFNMDGKIKIYNIDDKSQ